MCTDMSFISSGAIRDLPANLFAVNGTIPADESCKEYRVGFSANLQGDLIHRRFEFVEKEAGGGADRYPHPSRERGFSCDRQHLLS